MVNFAPSALMASAASAASEYSESPQAMTRKRLEKLTALRFIGSSIRWIFSTASGQTARGAAARQRYA
jgi:hypothetical protein